MTFDALKIVRECLYTGFAAVHRTEDYSGEEVKKTVDSSVDVSTLADKLAGEMMIGYLSSKKEISDIYTEEFGHTETNPDGRFSAIIDDIDGTKNFKEGLGMLPHGSIAGIFEGADPTFGDCLASGYLDFPSGNLFYAEKGKGAFVIEGWNKGGNEARKIKTTGRTQLFEEKNLTMLPDIYMLGDLAPAFMKYAGRAWLGDFRTSAGHLAMVACGAADIFVTCDNAFNPNKHKTGEELGPAYLLIKEAGGAMVDWNGLDVGRQRVALGEKRPWHMVAAATEELAVEFTKDMKEIESVREYMERKGLALKLVDADIGR